MRVIRELVNDGLPSNLASLLLCFFYTGNHSDSLEPPLLWFLDLCWDADVRHSDGERSSRYAGAQDTDDSESESLPPETHVSQSV